MPESNFPSSLDTDANDSLPKTISNTAALNSPNHAEMHGRSNDAIIEIEEKLGIGDTTPTSKAVLVGTGTGQSAWTTTPPLTKIVYASSGSANEGSNTINGAAIYICPDDPDSGADSVSDGDIWIDLA